MDCVVCGLEVSETKLFAFAEKFKGKNPLPPRPGIQGEGMVFAGTGVIRGSGRR